MGSFFYKLFLSTIGSMPAQYNPEVDGWWGVLLTELGILDPFREENRSCLLVRFLCVAFFALFLCALSLCNAYKNIRKERDDAREDSTKGADKLGVLDNKLRDAMNEIHHANARLQDADNGMDDERKEFRDTIQELNDQHLVNEEKIRSLTQDVSNTECDRDEHGRKLYYASQRSQKLEREMQQLGREKQQLEASLAEKENTINDLQAHKDDTVPEPVAAVTLPPIYTQPNDENETKRPVTTIFTLKDPAVEEAPADEEETDAHGIEFENRCDAHAKSSERLEKQVSAEDDELAERDGRVKDLEQQNGTLTTDFENLRDEHGECSEKLAGKDEEIRRLQVGKTTANNDSAETIASLRKELEEKGQEVEELEKVQGTSSADAVQRVSTLSAELEASRLAHAQCDEKSTSQSSRIQKLEAAKEQLEGGLRVKNNEIGQVTNDLKELQETHAKWCEHASTQASEMTALRNANKSLQESNTNLSREVELAKLQHTNLVGERQQVLNQYEALQNLHSSSQGEVRSLQDQLHTRNQIIEHQKQGIQTLETNCPKCQELREALDEVVKDVEMSDDSTRDELRKEITDSVRAELRSQVPDDLRRQIRGDIEREVRAHHSDLLASNTSRIREQDRLLSEKDAKLEKARTAPKDHAACERRQANLESKITRFEQDTNTARGNYSRLNNEAKREREQLKHAQTASENLRNELEKIKADQRRAQNINPLQGKLSTFQRELENMKADRNKARDNCSTYSKLLSDLRKNYEALQNECAAFRGKTSSDGDSVMDGGRTEEAIAVQNEQRTATSDTDRSTVSALHNEVARLSKELEERKARDKFRHPAMGNALPGNRRLARRFARQPTSNPVLGDGAGKKRDRDEHSDGEADDEGGDDRKKVKIASIEDGIHRLSAED